MNARHDEDESISEPDLVAWILQDLFGSSAPTFKVLTAILRDHEKPLSPEIRDILAELLDTSGPGFFHLHLVRQGFEKGPKKLSQDRRTLAVFGAHKRLLAEGLTSEEAAEQVAHDMTAAGENMSARTVHRKVAAAKAQIAWLHGKNVKGARSRRAAALRLRRLY